jgi:hypothetical protein
MYAGVGYFVLRLPNKTGALINIFTMTDTANNMLKRA